MKNIILIGMMGCGKTTVGRLLAQALGRELVDTDEAIERREGRSISDIFAQEGEPYFRDLEAARRRQPGPSFKFCSGRRTSYEISHHQRP